VLSYSRGSQVGNLTGYWYGNFDPYQGTVVFWIKPEWAGNDGIEHNIVYISANYRIYKSTGNNLTLTVVGLEAYGTVDAGDTYIVYGEDGVTAALGTVVSYTPATDALILDMGADLDCTYGGGMAAATVVKLAEN